MVTSMAVTTRTGLRREPRSATVEKVQRNEASSPALAVAASSSVVRIPPEYRRVISHVPAARLLTLTPSGVTGHEALAEANKVVEVMVSVPPAALSCVKWSVPSAAMRMPV